MAGKHAAERNVSGRQRARRKQAGRKRNAALTFARNEVSSSGLIDVGGVLTQIDESRAGC